MNEANDDTRMKTPGRGLEPHLASLTSGPQLVMPIWTGPCGVSVRKGPPLSPGQAWTSGARLLFRSCPQISEAMTAFGYAFAHFDAEMTVMSPVLSDVENSLRRELARP